MFNFGALPNQTTKSLLTDLSVTEVNIVKCEGFATGIALGGGYFGLTLPDINPGDYTQATRLTINSQDGFHRITVTTGIDRSNCNAFVTLEYTKTTD